MEGRSHLCVILHPFSTLLSFSPSPSLPSLLLPGSGTYRILFSKGHNEIVAVPGGGGSHAFWALPGEPPSLVLCSEGRGCHTGNFISVPSAEIPCRYLCLHGAEPRTRLLSTSERPLVSSAGPVMCLLCSPAGLPGRPVSTSAWAQCQPQVLCEDATQCSRDAQDTAWHKRSDREMLTCPSCQALHFP